VIKNILTFIFFFTTTTAFGQNKSVKHGTRPDSVGYYMHDDKTMAYSEASAKFVRLLIKTDSNMFRVNDYYMDGTPRLVVKSTVDSINFYKGARGICYEYYPNGKRKSIKNYVDGKLVGDAVTYYQNGGLHTVENYSAQEKYLKQYLDSAGNVLADNGNGKWVKTSENKIHGYMEGVIVNGKEDGPWKRHMKDTTYTIIYKQGDAISGNEYLKIKGDLFGEAEVVPTFPRGDSGFNQFLSRGIRYPPIARENNVQGKVILTFVVERDGSLSDIKIVRGIGSGCDEESVRVISLSPKWIPGTIKGKPVRVQYSLPITFALEHEPFPEPPNTSRRKGRF
jgi:TonB family protein